MTTVTSDVVDFNNLYESKEFADHVDGDWNPELKGTHLRHLAIGFDFGCWLMTSAILPDEKITVLQAFQIYIKTKKK